jgi:hypothetical protein
MSLVAIIYCLLLLMIWGIGLFRYARLTTAFKVLTWSFPVVFLFNIISPFFVARYRSNAPILHTECLTDFIFFSMTFYYLFKSKRIKKAILISIAFTGVFIVINAIYLQHFRRVFPTNAYYLTQTLFAIFSLLLFKEMLIYPSKIDIVKQSIFWYNTAILFYATTMFFYNGLSNYFPAHNIYDVFLYYFWYFICYLFAILLVIALLTDNKKIIVDNA